MTDEGTPNELTQGAEGDPEQITVLAEGRLDPRSIILRIIDRVSSLWLVVLLLAYRDPTEATLYVLMGSFMIVTSLLEYSRFRYRVTTEALEITAGIFTRRERRIPLDRIHDLSQSQSLVRRLLGVVRVNVETASSAGAEASLDALAPQQARELREALGQVTRRASTEAPEKPVRLHRSTPGELLLLGFTDNRAGLLVVGALLVFQELAGIAEQRTAKVTELLGRYIAQRIMVHGAPTVIALLVVAAIALLIAGWLVSAVLTWIKFGGFVLDERDGVFRRTYGMLTTREQSMPRRYLQILRLEESPLRRLVRLVVMRGDNAGSSLDPKNAQKAGLDVFVPAVRRAQAEWLVPRVWPGADVFPNYQRTSPTLWKRWGIRGGLLAAMVVAIGSAWMPHPAWWLALVLPVITTPLGWLTHRKLGWALDGDRLAVRWGTMGRYRAWMPRDRAQAVEVRATPFDRLAGVVHLRVVVTGGAQLRVGYLTPSDAEILVGFLAVANPTMSSFGRAESLEPALHS